MKSRFLLPHQLKLVGWILFIAGIIFMFFAFLGNAEPELFTVKTFAIAAITFDLGNTPHNTYFTFIENNLMDEMVELLLIIGGLLVAFSKNKLERNLLSKIDLIVIGAELFLIIHLFMGLLASTEVQIEAAHLFLGGRYTLPFWIFVVFIGMIIPAILEFLELRGQKIPVAIPVILILFGNIMLRFIIVYAGQASRYLY